MKGAVKRRRETEGRVTIQGLVYLLVDKVLLNLCLLRPIIVNCDSLL